MSEPKVWRGAWWIPSGIWSFFGVGAGFLLVLAVALVTSDQPRGTLTAIALVACGLGVAMAAVALIAGRRQPFCGICGEPKARLKSLLVAGKSASVCASCSDVLGSAVLEARLQRSDPQAFTTLALAQLAAVGAAPKSEAWLHLLALALDGATSMEQFDAVAVAAARIRNFPLAAMAVERIPAEKRTPSHLHLMSLARDAEGRFAEALALALEPDGADPVTDAVRRSNRAWFELNAGASAERLSVLLRDSEQACAEVTRGAKAPADEPVNQIRRAVTSTRVHLLVRLGRLDDAAAVLEEGLKRDGTSPHYEYANAAILRARGQKAEAAAAFKAVIVGNPSWDPLRRRSERQLAELGAS